MKTRIILTIGTDLPNIDEIKWESVLGAAPLEVEVQTQSLYCARFDKDYYRNGSIFAEYLCTEAGKTLLEAVVASKVEANLGEVLGKHSNVNTALTFEFRPAWADPQQDLSEWGFEHVDGLDPLERLIEAAEDESSEFGGGEEDSSRTPQEEFIAWCNGYE